MFLSFVVWYLLGSAQMHWLAELLTVRSGSVFNVQLNFY